LLAVPSVESDGQIAQTPIKIAPKKERNQLNGFLMCFWFSFGNLIEAKGDKVLLSRFG